MGKMDSYYISPLEQPSSTPALSIPLRPDTKMSGEENPKQVNVDPRWCV